MPEFGELSVFDEIYRTDYWSGGSGTGSTESATRDYRRFLQNFLEEKHIGSVVDLGCGDWQFSKLIDWSSLKYLGVDAATTVIESNLVKYSSETIRFTLLQSYEQLPEADLLIVKDVLQHLSRQEVRRIIDIAFPKFKYILLTNCIPPIRKILHRPSLFNRDIATGDYTYFDIRKAPYYLQADLALEWKIDKKSMPERFHKLVTRQLPSETNAVKWLKLPARIAKLLVMGRDCEWYKQTMLIEH